MKKQWNAAAAIPLRLILGFGFMYHGFPKLLTTDGHENFVAMLQGFSVPGADAVAWMVAAFEFFGGLALIVGAFTRVVSFVAIGEMLVAMFAVHLPAGFSFMNIIGTSDSGPIFGMPGYEVSLVYIAGFMALLLGGAGAASVDSMRHVEVFDGREAMLPGDRGFPSRDGRRPAPRQPVGAGMRDTF